MPFQPSKKKKRKRLKSIIPSLNLTALMDIFTIILLFLLKSYSVESEVLVPNPAIKLPVSTSIEAPTMRLVLQVSKDAIVVDGEYVTTVADALKGEDLLIKPLFDALNNNTEKIEFIAKNNPSIKFTGEVMIQGDKDIPFVLLERAMFTCGQAGYDNISLAVISRE